ncbi:MAG: PPA1309 family protein [Actinomycetaceae bacterium]|nr:PPA1309 family protein [Actinomycetaceae bacterium]
MIEISAEALASAVHDIERELAKIGWDQAPSLFALVPTKLVLEQSNGLDEQSVALMRSQLAANADNLTAVLQEDIGTDMGEFLAQIEWPEQVVGVACAMERIILPPCAEAAAPQEASARESYLLAHPDREDVRIVSGALRNGDTWTAIRTRKHDDADTVAAGQGLVPELEKALHATLN